MNRRRAFGLAVGLIGVVGIGLSAVPFVSSLAPSDRAKNDAEFVFTLHQLEPGKLNKFTLGNRVLFVLRPTEEQRKSISLLDNHVWSKASNNYVKDIDAFIYWGTSTKWDCDLEEHPPQESGLKQWSEKAKWLGGYWDPRCEVSYDYAGRAIRSYEFTYNGFNAEYPNLFAPKFKIKGEMLVVSLL